MSIANQQSNDPPAQMPAEAAAVQIKVIDNGPLQVKGFVHLVDHEGRHIPHTGKHVFLCRCGHSRKKPFCDGSHARTRHAATPPTDTWNSA